MQVTMRETRQGSPDGITVQTYSQGHTYEMPRDLAEIFINEEWAYDAKPRVETNPAASGAVTLEKNQGGAPENKNQGKGKSKK